MAERGAEDFLRGFCTFGVGIEDENCLIALGLGARTGWPGGNYDGLRGVNIHFTSGAPGEVEMLSKGFKIARMDFSWAATEKEKGVYNFSAYDGLLSEMTAKNVASYWILDYTNPLYCPNGSSPITEDQQTAFANWAAAVAAYFTGGELPIVFELYNEPNGGFWKNADGNPQPNATQYASLAMAVGAAIENSAPEAVFTGPTTAGVDLNFMETVFQAGALEYFDAVSCHPYRNTFPETVMQDYLNVAQLIQKYKPADRPPIPIISSEWGYTTCKYPCWPPGPNVTEVNQAKYAVRRYIVDDISGIPQSITYDWHNDFNNATAREGNFGSVYNQYQNASLPFLPKPEYPAVVTFHSVLLKNDTIAFSERINGDNDSYTTFVAGYGSAPMSYAAYAIGDMSTCSAVSDRQDCGYDGISENECHQRGCCFGAGNGPECFFPNLPSSGKQVAFATDTASQCYTVTNYDGTPASQVCTKEDKILNLSLTDGPIYLVPN